MGFWGLGYWVVKGCIGIVENQVEKNTEHAMETGFM